MRELSKSLQNSNYKMPAEWHNHAGTQMHWPSNRETWPGGRLHRVEKVYLDIIEVLHRYEPIHLLVDNAEMKANVRRRLESRGINLKKIIFHIQSTNDVWARDCGPIFIHELQEEEEYFAITDWEYNAWGAKYLPYEADNRLPKYFADKYNIKRLETNIVLEGGAIETNGNCVLLTTESVLLNDNRNPELTKEEIEQCLKVYLGVNKIIWLKRGLAGDDTDGHIDDLSRFLNERTILTMICSDPDNVNYAALTENLNILRNATDQHGNSFSIETLPLPETKIQGTTVDGSKHVPASYANFYIANGVVLVPLYDQRYDERVLQLFRQYFPERDVAGIECADLVWGQGSIHCITQQLYGLPVSNHEFP